MKIPDILDWILESSLFPTQPKILMINSSEKSVKNSFPPESGHSIPSKLPLVDSFGDVGFWIALQMQITWHDERRQVPQEVLQHEEILRTGITIPYLYTKITEVEI